MIGGGGTARPAIAAAMTIGIGLGGLFDGIVFHQILQLHNILSGWMPVTSLASAKVNMVWDGIFHAAVWIITLVGGCMLWAAAARGGVIFRTRYLVGGLLLGWGLFNLVEGAIDHHLLGAHHVVQTLGLSVWDYIFLTWGAGMAVLGWLLVRRP